ncbi:MAG TPA: hypothetical protein DCZ10_09040, partial [Pelotomaculum sp.]|nr:hypothetical protein [Pelotomaculum sp.]
MKKKQMPLCDIVLPVYNGLSYVKECINAIIKCTDDCTYHLYIVDDHSDSYTTFFLLDQVRQYPQHFSLHRNPQNMGFVRSC